MRRLELEEVERMLLDFDRRVRDPSAEQLEARAELEYALRNAKNLCVLFGTIDKSAVSEARGCALKLQAMYVRSESDEDAKPVTLH